MNCGRSVCILGLAIDYARVVQRFGFIFYAANTHKYKERKFELYLICICTSFLLMMAYLNWIPLRVLLSFHFFFYLNKLHLCDLYINEVFLSRKIVLLLVGLDNAGKTTAAKGLAGGNFLYSLECSFLFVTHFK